MAASQARYLALVARKSNCEYEGQQINQARLTLANQSANLFNQMLGLTVPVPPSSQDFTKTQYSYSDGTHSYVIDTWRQLPATETEYNYVVNIHYNADVYTGSMRTMADPQVQMSNPSSAVASIPEIESAMYELRLAATEMNAKYDHWLSVKSAQEAQIDAVRATAATNIGRRNYDQINTVDHTAGSNTYTLNADYNTYTAEFGRNSVTILPELKRMIELGIFDLDTFNQKLLYYGDEYVNDISDLDNPSAALRAQILQAFGLATETTTLANKFIVYRGDIDDIDETAGGTFYGYKIAGENFTITEQYLDEIEGYEQIIENARQSYNEAKDVYDDKLEYYNSLNQPQYIGNSSLTYLDTLTDEQQIELLQVVRDMKAQGIDTDILNCFDEDDNYLGGVYTFTMYGVPYYTTYTNLLNAYASNIHSNNYIDDQYRLPYYNASYIETRVDRQSRALIETDGNGRFTSIRFENDSVTYTLNTETVTDDVAYQDAMNKYYYDNAVYDKMIQDINAKTSIIQKEDKELELRLKQLDTEQNALSTEIDAVSKVVKDNIESSFKTFGG